MALAPAVRFDDTNKCIFGRQALMQICSVFESNLNGCPRACTGSDLHRQDLHRQDLHRQEDKLANANT